MLLCTFYKNKTAVLGMVLVSKNKNCKQTVNNLLLVFFGVDTRYTCVYNMSMSPKTTLVAGIFVLGKALVALPAF